MDTTMSTNIEMLLKDERLCKSENMKRFFKKVRNRHYGNVIRFEGKLWFAMLGWDDGNSFSGVSVIEVACQGARATTCFPLWQHPSKWEDVTDWFWAKYWEYGIVSITEVWNRRIPRTITSKEAHSI